MFLLGFISPRASLIDFLYEFELSISHSSKLLKHPRFFVNTQERTQQ